MYCSFSGPSTAGKLLSTEKLKLPANHPKFQYLSLLSLDIAIKEPSIQRTVENIEPWRRRIHHFVFKISLKMPHVKKEKLVSPIQCTQNVHISKFKDDYTYQVDNIYPCIWAVTQLILVLHKQLHMPLPSTSTLTFSNSHAPTLGIHGRRCLLWPTCLNLVGFEKLLIISCDGSNLRYGSVGRRVVGVP